MICKNIYSFLAGRIALDKLITITLKFVCNMKQIVIPLKRDLANYLQSKFRIAVGNGLQIAEFPFARAVVGYDVCRLYMDLFSPCLSV